MGGLSRGEMWNRRRRVPNVLGVGSSLLTGLVAYWHLDEASGARGAAVGSFSLTDNNTVLSSPVGGGSPANLPSTVATFVAGNSEYLSYAGQTFAPEQEMRALSFWFRTAEVTLRKGLLGVGATPESGIPQWFFRLNGSHISVYTGIDGAGTHDYTDGPTVLSNGTWYHVLFTYSHPGWTLYLNGSSEITDADGLESVTPEDTNFYIGVAFPGYISMDMSSVGFWDRVVTAGERAALWNGGDAGVYPFTGL